MNANIIQLPELLVPKKLDTLGCLLLVCIEVGSDGRTDGVMKSNFPNLWLMLHNLTRKAAERYPNLTQIVEETYHYICVSGTQSLAVSVDSVDFCTLL